MEISEQRWFSPSLNKEMTVKIYGHWGAPILVFPCSLGRYFDYEGMGMIDAIAEIIDAGRVKIYCVDSIDAESWYNFAIPPTARNDRYQAYDRYIADEIVPFIRNHCREPELRILTNGCSMGAYHALNLFLKRPDLFAGTIALSGLYRLDRTEFGLTAEDIAAVYYNSPLHYLAGLEDRWYLDWYKKSRIIVCTGQGAWEDEAVEDTHRLHDIFKEKRIPAWIDFWGVDVSHDWPWWFRQMNYFLDALY